MLGRMLTGLDRIGVYVNDLAVAKRTYATLLGRSPTWRGSHPASATENVIFRLSNTCIELVSPADARAAEGDRSANPVAKQLAESGEGIAFLAFATDDIEDARARCKQSGLDVPEPRDELMQDSDSGAFRRFSAVDLPLAQTGGVPIQLVEHRSPEALLQPGPPIGREEATTASLDHVVIMTKAPERAIELYRNQLGIRLALDRSFEQRGVRLLFFRIGGTTVEIGASLRESSSGESDVPPGDDRLWGAAYRVLDVDAARARLVDAGVGTTDIRTGNKPGTRVFTITHETHGVPTLVIGDG